MRRDLALQQYREDPGQFLVSLCPDEASVQPFIRRHIPRAVVGVSGGVDSALIVALLVRAIGAENVYGVILPAGNQAIDQEYAINCLETFGVSYQVINLQEMVEVIAGASDLFSDSLAVGNLKARLRMVHLYAQAARRRGLVVGTGNRSEIMTGYFTKYGDGGSDILPIGHLFKTWVWKMSRQVGVPEVIVERPPTAGLWPGQTDEGEMGIRYGELDQVLLGLDLGIYPDDIEKATGITLETIEAVIRKVHATEHKRAMPPRPPLLIDPADRPPLQGPVMTVDAIARYGDRYVMIKRGHSPFRGKLAFPGGLVDRGESCEDAVIREMKEETNLDFTIRGLLGVYSNPDRDPRGHYASVVFYGRAEGTPRSGDDAKEVLLLERHEVREMAFDHDRIWEGYLKWVNE